MRVSTTFWLLLPLLLFSALLRTSDGAEDVSTGGFVDKDECHAALFRADANGDRRIVGDEYVTVIQLLGPPGFIDDAETFDDLPRILKQSFNLLACLCSIDSTNEECCVGDNAHISNLGTGPGETPSADQEVYLFSVCLTTERAIQETIGTTAPTPSPSLAPTVTPEPSLVPTSAPVTPVPTFAPVTPAPVTPAPITPAPVTPAPITPAPVTKSPVTMPPVTMMPVTAAPVSGPTDAPTTAAPVVPTTPMPVTTAPVSAAFPVVAAYEVAFRQGVQGSYAEDLSLSMDVLAPQVIAETFPDLRLRRRLTVNLGPPTAVTGGIPSECPDIINSSDTCQTVLHSITLLIVDENDARVEEAFLVALDVAIRDGRLQRILETEINPDSTVYIVSGLRVPPTSAPTNEGGGGGLGAGPAAGIAIGAIALVVIVGAGLYVARMRRQAEKDEDSYFPGATQQAVSATDVDRDLGGDGTLGASQADYRINKSKSAAAIATLEDGGVADRAAPTAENRPDQSSDAGSSGWSSSAGVSSLNTGSVDSIEGDSIPPGASLAAIGAASALAASRKKDRSADDIPDMPDVSRDDLDSAIEAGDWAAVGATAALLAAASDSQSYSSRSRKTDTSGISRGGSSISSMDAARAAELDHLVDAGDWEGVVVAAAKFEASEDTSTGASNTSKTGGSSGHSQASTSLSESPSKLAKRDEIREEVENLVRRVVPEEIDNVDEMMMQFKGREEELVETLRTMQERQVAQKARVQGQKQAKRDARQTSREGGLALPGIGAASAGGSSTGGSEGLSTAAAAGIGVGVAAAAGIAAAVGAAASGSDSPDSDSDSGTGSDSDPSQSQFAAMAIPSMLGTDGESRDGSPTSSIGSEHTSKKRRTQLELAIEAGDWEAVGEAAAMMSDQSVNSASTGEIDRIAGGDTSSTYSAGSSENRYQVNAERAAELDDMIDQGDWTGVVAAASRFSSADTSGPPEDTATSSGGDGTLLSAQMSEGVASGAYASTASGASSVDEDRDKRLKEEQEALAQAEIWMSIAEQSKTEGAEDAGASDAADWAIARSLSALKTAEAKGDLEKSESDADDSQNSGDASV